MTEVLDIARDLVLRAAPDLADTPLYLFGQVAGLMPAGAGAFAAPLDPLWQSRLEVVGQWRGVGRLVVIHEAVLAMPLEYLVGCLVHECAHLLPAQPPTMIGTTIPDAIALCRSLEARDIKRDVDEWPGAGAACHGPDWCRRLLHLRYRVQAHLRDPLPFDTLGVYHGPCHVSLMARRLGDEPNRLAHATFSDIEQTPPPAAFTALWAARPKE